MNSLYILTPEAYLTLDGENVVVKKDGVEMGRFPLHSLEQIVTFSYMGASPALMGKCAEQSKSLSFFTQSGRFLARIDGGTKGNVLLRRQQYRLAENRHKSPDVAKNFIIGKIYNSRWVLERALRDHPMSIDSDRVRRVSLQLRQSILTISHCIDADELRGIEGEAASEYFSVFNELILNKDEFHGRSHRKFDIFSLLLTYIVILVLNLCKNL